MYRQQNASYMNKNAIKVMATFYTTN